MSSPPIEGLPTVESKDVLLRYNKPSLRPLTKSVNASRLDGIRGLVVRSDLGKDVARPLRMFLAQLLASEPSVRVLLVSHRRVSATMRWARALGFVSPSQHGDSDFAKPLLVILYQSLVELVGCASAFDYVILDEAEATATDITAPLLFVMELNTQILDMVLRHWQPFVIAMCADAGERTLSLLRGRAGDRLRVEVNEHRSRWLQAHIIDEMLPFMQRIKRDLEAGRRLAVCLNSADQGFQLLDWLQKNTSAALVLRAGNELKTENTTALQVRYSFYHNGTADEKAQKRVANELADLDTAWAPLDLLLFTSDAPCTGSFDVSKHFHSTYLLACPAGAHARLLVEAMSRITGNETGDVWVHVVDGAGSTDVPAVRTHAELVRALLDGSNCLRPHERTLVSRSTKKCGRYCYETSPSWVLDALAHNKLEEALSSQNYGQQIRERLRTLGYQVSETVSHNECG